MRWGMVVDLKLCIGCNTCVLACKAGRGTPKGIFYNKVLEQEVGKFPHSRRIFWPTRCNHCEEPSCHEVCPTGATSQRDDGIVMVDSKKCLGCKACILACPYGARTVLEDIPFYFGTFQTPYEEIVYPAYHQGAVHKCDFCVDRLDEGLQPYCVESCITGALIFGDLDDPNSDVNLTRREGRISFKLKEEIGTKPCISYLRYE